MRYYAGIDVGTTSTKISIIDQKEEIIGYLVSPTGSDFRNTTFQTFNNLLSETGLSKHNIKFTVSTGYGRKLVDFSDETISEISANAEGVKFFQKEGGDIRTIIDIGGQDSKVIALDNNGKVKNFVMNDKCAAGTGRFLEVMARILEINLTDLGDLSLQAKIPVMINSTCTVFAESEVISLLARGKAKSEIIAGLHYSIARRIVRLAKRIGIEEMVFFDGGPALNKGLVRALEDESAREIYIPPAPQITTAIGAALIAKEAFLKEVHTGSINE